MNDAGGILPPAFNVKGDGCVKKKANKKKRNNLITVAMAVLLLAGLSLLLYPSIADWWNSSHQTRVISDYTSNVAVMDPSEKAAMIESAQEHNKDLAENEPEKFLSDKEMEKYNSLLNVSGDGVMGYVEIPSIQCSLPIYHGNGEDILQSAVGHLEWSSLPVGGESTHCVLSGHRGLPSAKLFTRIDEMTEGDVFTLHVLDDVLTYKVDQILIVEPVDTDALQIEEGKDYCTLVTCTPYGVNTHRLLVRGHRIPSSDINSVPFDALQIEPMIVASVMAIPVLLVLVIIVLIPRRKGKENSNENSL